MIDTKTACRHFKETRSPLSSIIDLYGIPKAPHEHSSKTYAAQLYSSIISQQISVKAADAIEKRFLDLVGDVHNTDAILSLDVEVLRSIGLSRQKASYILSIAEHVKNGSVRFEELDTLSDNEVIAELTLIKGVGTWTAEMFLMFTLCRPDIFSVGDLGLLNAARKLFNNPTMSKDELKTESKNWAPYRTSAALLLWRSLDNKPLS